jgi:hypothetical protein
LQQAKEDTWISKLAGKISSKWISFGTLMTLFSLIVLPTIVVLSAYLRDYLDGLLADVYFAEVPLEISVLNYFVAILHWLVITILLIFPPYPFPISIKRYFKAIGYENAVIEYELVKKILYISVPLFIILTVVLPYLADTIKKYESINIKIALDHPTFRFVQNYLLLIVFAGLLKVMVALIRKDFKLYYAKGCFKNIILRTNDLNEARLMNYLTKGLTAYNSYIKRNTHLQIKDLTRIISEISVTNQQEKDERIRELAVAFDKEDKQTMKHLHLLSASSYDDDFNIENETLRPLRKLYEYSQPVKANEFLVEQSFMEKVKENIAFAATIPPLIISFFELYVRIKGTI